MVGSSRATRCVRLQNSDVAADGALGRCLSQLTRPSVAALPRGPRSLTPVVIRTEPAGR